MQTDTIAAIATAVSDSGIGIIRISGSDALLVADKVYRSPKNQKSCHRQQAIPFIMDIYMMKMS